MSDILSYTIKFDTNGNAVFDTINKLATKLQQNISKTQSICDKFGASFMKLNAIGDSIRRVGEGLANINKPGIELNSAIADLSAITGVGAEKLELLEESARKAAITFGGSAAQNVESYKIVLSKLGPAIADTPEALAAMGNSINVLSKTMGGDSVAAANVLTTAMNQFQVSLDDPNAAASKMSEMMNIMAAAAKEGSAELPQIQAALEQSGMAAKMAGISFSEANAAIQVLDKAGKKGSEGGIALRNTIMKMSEGRFMPKDVLEGLKQAGVNVGTLSDKSLSLTDRLRPLQKVLKDSALLGKMFGMENANAAMALISGIPQIDTYNKAIQGTNTAQEQANTKMESAAEKTARMQARIDELKIKYFDLTGASAPFISVAVQTVSTISDLVPAFMMTGKAIAWLTKLENLKNIAIKTGAVASWVTQKATIAWDIAQKALNGTMLANPYVAAAVAIIAIGTAVYFLMNKTSQLSQSMDNISEKAAENSADERSKLDILFAAINKTNSGSTERLRLAKEMRDLYPDLLKGIDLENGKTNDLSIAYDKVAASIDKKARAMAMQDELVALYKQQRAQQKDMMSDVGIMDMITSMGNPALVYAQRINKSKETNDAIKALLSEASSEKLNSISPQKKEVNMHDSLMGKISANIASGGARGNYTTVQLGKLYDNIIINPATSKEGIADLEKMILEAMLKIVSNGNAMAGGK